MVATREADASPRFITVARVVKTQGRRGELAAELLTDSPERFSRIERLYLWRPPAPPEEFRLVGHWFHQGRVVLALAGIDDLDRARLWLGAEVQVPAVERVIPPDGRYFVSDLEGCEVFDGERRLGRLDQVIEQPSAPPLLRVMNEEGEEILIPFAAEYVAGIDVVGTRRITLRLPEGLAELNRGTG